MSDLDIERLARAICASRPPEPAPDLDLFVDDECRRLARRVAAEYALADGSAAERDYTAALRAENARLRAFLALRPSGFTGSMEDRIPWFQHCGISHGADRPDCVVCAALATEGEP